MKLPNLNEEKKLWKRGFRCVVGLDEAGRGPLSGPVVAGAVAVKTFNSQLSISNFQKLKGVKDSKQLSEQQREKLFKVLINHPQIKWGIGIVSEKVIDKINILEATKLAMLKAIANLNSKPDFLLLDGNFKIKSKIQQKSIIKGDTKVFSISSASIIAKVTRDRIMLKYDKKYPKYGFKQHKGYPTKSHIEILKKIGPCPIHRKSFSW